MPRSRKYQFRKPKRTKTRKFKTRRPKRTKTRSRRGGVNSPDQLSQIRREAHERFLSKTVKKSPSPKNKTPSPKNSPSTIKVTVLAPNGDELTFNVAPQTTIGDLKTKIEEQKGYLPARQLLFDNENELANTKQILTPMNLALIIDFNPIESNEKLKELVHNWHNNIDIEKIEEEYGPLSEWDTSNVTNMEKLFQSSKNFNQPLNDWDVSNVENMEHIFMNFAHPPGPVIL